MDQTWLSLPGDRRIAVRHRPGSGPTVLFLPGYASDMRGSKAEALDRMAAEHGSPLLRFDYSGTGESSGSFEHGTLDGWLDEAAAVAALAEGPLLLIGSSMGGWLMLHLAERLGAKVAGLIGIAAAPDFTDWGYDEAHKAQLARGEDLRRDNPYGGDAELTTAAFWRSGERMKLLDRSVAISSPVRLLHGDRDAEVPIEIAFRLKDALASDDVQLTIVKGGTHRLSAPHELDLLGRTVRAALSGG